MKITVLERVLATAVVMGCLVPNTALAQTAPTSATKPLIEKWLDGEVKAKQPPVTYNGAPITLRFSTFLPNFPLYERAFKRLEADTNGKLIIRPYWGNSLANAQRGAFESISSGIADFGNCYSAFSPGGFKLTPGLAMPFLFESASRATHAAMKIYPKHLKQEYEAKNVYLFRIVMTRPSNLLTIKEPIERLEQLQGKRVLSSGTLINEYIKALGAAPTALQVSELYSGFQSGVIDTAANHDAAMALFRLIEIGKHHTTADLWPSAFEHCMNKGKFDGLPADLKQIFYHWAQLLNHAEATMYYDREADAARRSMEQRGVRMVRLPDAERARWNKQLQPVVDNFVSSNGNAGAALVKSMKDQAELVRQLSDDDIARELLDAPIPGVVSF